tara:strand:- start:687 stop:881 length:195 start_codon:yes stop_codon:yes gene_type:complete
MRVGSLVQCRATLGYHGIVMEIGPEQTLVNAGRAGRACRVQWFDGEETLEFIKTLEVVSEPVAS